VRPEDVRIETQATPSAAVEAHAIVRMIEMLGDSAVATLEVLTTTWDSGKAAIVHKDDVFHVLSKMEPRIDLRTGQRVGVRVDASRTHLFDPASGENWVRRPAA
jgi:ABC-type sugar transport system ATPase subunit